MKYAHIRNLEKYQDGYKDRKHYWAKIYHDMIMGDMEVECLNEVDFSRLVKFIVIETCYQKPTPLSESFLSRRGFDFSSIGLDETIKNLSHFIEIVDVTETVENCNESLHSSVENRYLEKSRVEKSRVDIYIQQQPQKSSGFKKPSIEEVKAHFGGKGFPAEADKFFDYYEANGWKVGRNPMKNWQSAVANWLRNAKSYGRLESASGFNLNKTQQKNAEALSEFLKRQGTTRPEDLCSGNDASIVVLPVSKSSA